MSIRYTALDIGTPSSGFQEWEITPVHIHGFESLDATRGEFVESPEFACFGHQWHVRIFPGGRRGSDDGMVSVVLSHMSDESIEVEWGITVKKLNGREVIKCDGRSSTDTIPPNSLAGLANFAKRSVIMSSLVAGTLVVEVRMRCTNSTPPATAPFIAGNPLCDMILKMFMDEETADIVFEVEDGNERVRNTRKRTPTSIVKFHAHRLILKQCAPMLAELICDSEVTSASIPDVKPEIFRHVLYYVYGGKVAEEDLMTNAKAIIEAANRFGVVNLKLEAEASYVKSTTIGVSNVMEHLLYADAMNCALLKETAMDFIVENKAEVIEQVSFEDVPGGLFPDFLAATSRKLNQYTDGGVDGFNAMRISDLRKKLHEKGLNVDGSRETLIATLKENVREGTNPT